jgi:hypothetical protein
MWLPRRLISAYENWRRLSMTFIGNQISWRRYTGWPGAISGIGALMQTV